MDEYEEKFNKMKTYIPFLEAMIERLEKVSDNSREVQMQKMQQLLGILTSNKKKLKLETLQKCEDVLQKLHSKVEKGTSSNLNIPSKSKKSAASSSTNGATSSKRTETMDFKNSKKVMPQKKMNETPASPTPPSSPVELGSKLVSTPIIIPTESKHDITNSKPASPDQIETMSTKTPIIIPTERRANSPDNAKLVNYNEWNISSRRKSLSNVTRIGDLTSEEKSSISSSSFKTSNSTTSSNGCGSSTSINTNSGSSNSGINSTVKNRHIPTVPIPIRRLSSGSDKNHLGKTNSEGTKSSSKKIDPPKHSKQTSNKPTLLIPPPPSLKFSDPPLSIKDLDELLSEGNDKLVKESEKFCDKSEIKSFSIREQEKSNEREIVDKEVNKHNATSKETLAPSSLKSDVSKNKLLNSFNNFKKSLDSNKNSSSTIGKNSDEPRYSENYERKPRYKRDNHNSNSDFNNFGAIDMNVINSAFSNLSEGDIANLSLVQNNLHIQTDNYPVQSGMYPRHLQPPYPSSDVHPSMIAQPEMSRNQDYQNSDYYNMHGANGVNSGFGNASWGHNQHLRGPQLSPRQANYHHGDMWNMGSNAGPMDKHHNAPLIPNQYGSNPNHSRSLLSPEDMSISPPTNRIPPLMSINPLPQQTYGYPDNRANNDFSSKIHPHRQPQWDSSSRWDMTSPPNRPSQWDIVPPPPPHPPPSGNQDTIWPRNNSSGTSKGRGSERFPNERNRPGEQSQAGGFNRSQNRSNDDSVSRFGIRDPRVRSDLSQKNNSSVNKRDPRLAKDSTATSTSTATTKDNNSTVSRDPRRRNSDSKDTSNKPVFSTMPKSKSNNALTGRRNSLEGKLNIEKMQSPLESLYGVIDTTPKTGKGYGLQKFKIPKIKRPELKDLKPRPPTPPKANTYKDDWDPPSPLPPPPPPPPLFSVLNKEEPLKDSEVKQDDKSLLEEKKIEVTSTTEETNDQSTTITSTKSNNDLDIDKLKLKEMIKTDCKDDKISEKVESEAIVDTSTPSKAAEKVEDKLQIKESVTQELIESLIRKSLQCGEGKKLLDQAKLLQGLPQKKYKKIQKILHSDSESSSSSSSSSSNSSSSNNSSSNSNSSASRSNTNVTGETKKVLKKKRRVILSDSSDNESDYDSGDNAKLDKTKLQVNSKAGNKEKLNKKVVDKTEDESKVKTAEEIEPIKRGRKPKLKTQKMKAKNKSERIEEIIRADSEEPKDESSKKVKKPAQKRRNSLDMLQEDLRESFISDDVMAATGFRMCRLAKDDSKATKGPIKLNDNSGSSDRLNEIYSDESEVSTPRGKPGPKSKTKKHLSEESLVSPSVSKTKTKTKKQLKRKKELGTTRKQLDGILCISSDSDNEEEESLSNRLNAEDSTSKKTKSPLKSSSPTPPETNDNSGTRLRRSGRVVAMKEPRVIIEKTELSKIDSSKIMFDTSSDESFGIDASELTAAVDISLHPEQSKDTAKMAKPKAKKTQKKCPNVPSDQTVSTPIPFEDDAVSDVSISSSNASSIKKLSAPATDTNEELISNIIGGLGNKTADGLSDAETNEDVDTSVQGEGKKPPLKRKKKSNWQMGKIPKAKKRKSARLESISTISSDLSHLDDLKEVSNDKKENEVPSVSPSKINAKTAGKSPNQLNKILKLDISKLIEYTWTGQEKYKCLLCSFNGKNIVNHYKNHHSDTEVLISRLTFLDAKRAINEAKDEEFIKLSKKINSGTTRKFSCRFCSFTVKDEKDRAMKAFYEHCTSHTGEYRFTCKVCNFQAFTKSSVRNHYVRLCRKSFDNLESAIVEDPIPTDIIYGHLCSYCNFIQLKLSNVEQHVKNMHRDVENVKIITINMSSYLQVKESETFNHSIDDDDDDDVNMKILEFSDNEDRDVNVVDDDEDDDDDENPLRIDESLEIESNDPKQPDDSKESEDKNDKEDSNSVNKKLSVFVCPPELENKEDEIQTERRKKMQEIVNNIGIKIQKPSAEVGLSIIDKVKDKITTLKTKFEPEVDICANNDKQLDDNANDRETESFEVVELGSAPESLIEQASNADETSQTNVVVGEEMDRDPIDIDSNGDKSEKKLKDPLTCIQDSIKQSASEAEGSDNEPIIDVTAYESDTSDELSDPEIPTDVNSLLKDAEIKNPTNAPMMTTIQRLAAQLTGVKNVSSANSEDQSSDGSFDPLTLEFNSDSTDKPVDIENSKEYLDQSNCLNSSINKSSREPRIFLRARRLSGDLLSVPGSSSSSPLPVDNSKVESPSDSNIINDESVNQSNDQSNEEPFFKIENVVSLAPNASGSNENDSLISDIRQVVTSSPSIQASISQIPPKTVGVSLLKSSTINSTVMKQFHPINSVDSIITRLPPIAPAPLKPSPAPAAPKPPIASLQPLPAKNYKVVRIIKNPSIVKAKDSVIQTTTSPKLKTVEAYGTMLKAFKLRHLYKCMARSCTHTSDSADQYGKHYQQHHFDTLKMTGQSAPNDYQKCPYCSESLLTYDDMLIHYKKKHSFCSFQCSYCFYRAFTQSYVELHQGLAHPGKPLSVILGMRDNHPKELVDRREYVHPFICKHECNKLFYVPEAFIAHLKTKHGPTLSMFKCHMCTSTVLKAEKLVSHYKLHGIYKYQCLYCLFGADATLELHQHLSTMHCNRPPKVLERSLPPSPVRDVDVLLQLVIRNLDTTFKCSELKVISETSTASMHAVPTSVITSALSNSINSTVTTTSVASTSGSNIVSNSSVIAPSTAKNLQTSTHLQKIILTKTVNNVKILPRPVKIVGPTEVIDLIDKEKSVESKNSLGNIVLNAGELKKNNAIPVLKSFIEKPINSGKTVIVKQKNKLPTFNIIQSEPTPIIKKSKSNTNLNSSSILNSSSTSDQSILKEPEIPINFTHLNSSLTKESGTEPEQLQPQSQPQSQPQLKPDPDSESILKEQEPILKEPELPIKYANEKIKNRIDNAVDPLSIPDSDLNSADEFININVLDRPEILGVSESIFKTSSDNNNADDDNINVENNNDDEEDDDSDIEIIQHFQRLEDSSNQDNLDESKGNKASEKEEKLSETNDGENLEEDSGKIPLTLEDIKDTGLSGKELYKCGYAGCNFSADEPIELKSHILECSLANKEQEMICVHCRKRFFKIGKLTEHFKIHSLKRYSCFCCKKRFAILCHAKKHVKHKHKVNNAKLIPADPKNPISHGLFIIIPLKPQNSKKKGGKIKSPEKDSGVDEKISFSPSEIDALPRQAIYVREVQCAVCPYTTKVRTNIIRHLQLHAKDETVPESGPVNPVPCLDKKERMFDKMVNLASSSHENGRMGGGGNASNVSNAPASKDAVTTSELELLPKYVPEQNRYVCGVLGCNHLTIDESMLRSHLKALHPDKLNFRCLHCPAPLPGREPQNISIEKMGIHLKMHDTKLYKCSHCNYHHYHRYVVEKHLLDKHSEVRSFVKVIREIEIAEPNPGVNEESEEGPTDKDGGYWKCNSCDFRCVYKTEMISHASSVHNEKCQFRCTVCSAKSGSRVGIEGHISSKHFNEVEVDYTVTYEKVKGPKKAVENEPANSEEPFDTTPLWRRNMPRIRHIRGILLEDEGEANSTPESPVKLGKRKSDADISNKPAKIRNKSGSLDGSIVETNPNPTEINLVFDSEQRLYYDFKDACEKLKGCEIGSPIGCFYVCPICPAYKSKFRQDIRDHIYRDLKYWRFYCKSCGYLTVNNSYMKKHFVKKHKNEPLEIISIVSNEDIENWVQTLLATQWKIMRSGVDTNKAKTSNPTNVITLESPVKTSSPTPSSTSASSSPVKKGTKHKRKSPLTVLEDRSSPSIIEETNDFCRKVDLTSKISSISSLNTGADSDENDDEDALIIDSKYDNNDEDVEINVTDVPNNVKDENEVEVDVVLSDSGNNDEPKDFVCKHCFAKFDTWRGYKIHIRLKHLKRLKYLCPYCDKSNNSEAAMFQHIRSKHPGQPEEIKLNPAASAPDPSNEFWEKEYGLVLPKKAKRAKKKPETVISPVKNVDGQCKICSFVALNTTGLRAHMRAHTNKHILKCVYCSFTSNSKIDIWQHSELNHPDLDWKAEEIKYNKDGQPAQQFTKSRNVDYSEDIEEEVQIENNDNAVPSTSTSSSTSTEVVHNFVYGCFYCVVRSNTLDSVKKHWEKIHKDFNEISKSTTGVPFRYKEVPVRNLSEQKILKCSYCPKKGSLNVIKYHLNKKHPNLPMKYTDAFDKSHDTWICNWCNESVEANSKLSHHQMFHSHLAMSFKKEHEVNMIQRGYVCPQCEFICLSISKMKKHVSKHCTIYKCKLCNQTFPNYFLATRHNGKEHPGQVAAVEKVTLNVNTLMDKVFETNIAGSLPTIKSTDETVKPSETVSTSTIGAAEPKLKSAELEPKVIPSPSKEMYRNLGVAKKSTTKQLLRSPSTFPVKRSVARKSTTPVPRYLPGFVFNLDDDDDNDDASNISSSSYNSNYGYSYYGKSKEKIDLNKINTTMALGGANVKVKCAALALIMNLNAYVRVEDIKKN